MPALVHLDDEDGSYLATVRALAPRVCTSLSSRRDSGESVTTQKFVIEGRVANAATRVIARTLQQQINLSGCSHDFDCCGCHFDRAYLVWTGRKAFALQLWRQRNV